MNQVDRRKFGKMIENAFAVASSRHLHDRELERLDRAIFEIGDTLGFSPEEIEEIRESLG